MQSSYDREVRAAAFAYVTELTGDDAETISWAAPRRPEWQPDPEAVELRWARFRAAS